MNYKLNTQDLKIISKQLIDKMLSNKLRIAVVVLFLLSPIFGGLLNGFYTNTSIFKYDARYTGMNDEIGYIGPVVTIRKFGHITGEPNYNEYVQEHTAWGAHNPSTFITYILASFITGIDNPNFLVHCNILLFILASFVYFLLCRPPNSQLIILTLILSVYSIAMFYAWSSMAEGQLYFAGILIISISMYLWKYSESVVKQKESGQNTTKKDNKKEIIFLSLLAFLILFYTTVRPYFISFFIILLFYICFQSPIFKKKIHKAVGVLIIILLACVSAKVFVYLYKYTSVFFSSIPAPGSTLQKLSILTPIINNYVGPILEGNFSVSINNFIKIHSDIFKFLFSSFPKDWQANAFILSLIECFFLAAVSFTRKKRPFKLLFLAVLIVNIAIFEINLHFYSGQYHRMLLASNVATLFLIVYAYKSSAKRAFYIQYFCFFILSLLFVAKTVPMPQAKDTFDFEKYKKEIAQVLPYSKNEGFDNNIATVVSHSNLHIFYTFPPYIQGSCCFKGYIKRSIKNQTIKSKYVFNNNHPDLEKLLKKRGFKLLWDDGKGNTIYQLR